LHFVTGIFDLYEAQACVCVFYRATIHLPGNECICIDFRLRFGLVADRYGLDISTTS